MRLCLKKTSNERGRKRKAKGGRKLGFAKTGVGVGAGRYLA